MLGIGAGELVVIIILGLLIVGPERLPVMIRDGTRWVRDLRRMVEATRRDLTEQIGPELRDLGVEDLRDLDPRQYVRRHILDGLDDDEHDRERDAAGRTNGATRARSSGSHVASLDEPAVDASDASTSQASAARPAFDPDTT